MFERLKRLLSHDNLENEFLPPALEIQESPPSPLPRLLIWLIFLVVLTALLWACIGTVEIVAEARGRVIPDGRVKVLQPLEEGVVKAIHVAEGQRVRAGQVLIEFDPTLRRADVESSVKSLSLHRTEKARLMDELAGGGRSSGGDSSRSRGLQGLLQTARESEYRAREEGQKLIIAQRESALHASEAILAKLEKTREIVAEQEASLRSLQEGGYISRMEWREKQKEFVGVEQELEAQRKVVQQGLDSLEEARRTLDAIRNERNRTILTDIVERERHIASMEGEVVKARRMYDLEKLVAPVDGVVHGLSAYTVGGVVEPAEDLVSIVPDGTPFIIEVMVLNKDVGFIRVSQLAEIKLDTFPFQKYGTIRAEVLSISPDAIEDQKMGMVYKVRVKPAWTDLLVEGRRVSIAPGMTASVEIKTGSRRIIEFFLSPIIKYARESISVR